MIEVVKLVSRINTYSRKKNYKKRKKNPIKVNDKKDIQRKIDKLLDFSLSVDPYM